MKNLKNKIKSLKRYISSYMEKRKRSKILKDPRLKNVETTSEARSILYSMKFKK